jgi:asparagine synthase (glutamine-hydrolysing)
MCGIFALLNNEDCYTPEEINESFMKGQKRGPEFSELKEVDNNLLFGFHRLAINGLTTTSNQPMTIDGITIICNGEIYNYKQLFTFINIIPETQSDCEIIIHLYKHYGIEYTLQLLDGVFAFILYDKQKELLYVARDPYGVRPLYMLNSYTHNNDLANSFGPISFGPISFASELKVLSGLFNKIKKDKNKDKKGENNEDDNVNITQFKPGHYMSFKKYNTIFNVFTPYTKYNTHCFSSDIMNNFPKKLNSIYFELCDKLIYAVKKRVVGTTDRPVACLLSGGLDSSLIAALVSKFYPGKLETYSIGMKGSEDLKYAELVAEHIESNHTSIIVSEEDFLEAIPEVIKAIESYDTTSVRASVGNYLIGKYIAKHSTAKVIFNGDGSDELAGGYLYFHAAPNNIEFDRECKRLLTDIHAFDVLRSDKCISSHGLEPRTPFLDRGWVDYYLSIPLDIRKPKPGQMEKNLIRTAFSTFEPGLLPDCVLWRRKEAFSDGVSSQHKSWYQIISEHMETLNIKENDNDNNDNDNDNNDNDNDNNDKYNNINIPKTKEQLYYRAIYDEAYPDTANLIPYFWMPRFIESTDPSARTLKIY